MIMTILCEHVGLRRRPALAGADGMPTRQARVLWNVRASGNARALGNALSVQGGLRVRVLYVKGYLEGKSIKL